MVYKSSTFIKSATTRMVLFIVLFLTGMSGFNRGDCLLSTFMGHSVAGNLSHTVLFTEEKIEYFDQEITRILTKNNFNGTILVSRFGFVIYKNAFGYAGSLPPRPVDLETTFQIASITKTFTAAAILILQQDGLLHINDKVVNHIPDFPYQNITIQHLLSHTSGLQNYLWLLDRYWNKNTLPDNEDVLDLFIKTRRPLNFRPGQLFEYSNSGYVILGLLIERVSGMSYPDFIHKRIFEPLGMTRSYVLDLHNSAEIDNRAYGFRVARGQQSLIPGAISDGPLGDKGIFSTVGDLHKWDMAIHSNALLPAEIWRLAFTHARLNNNTPVDYGLGWRLRSFLDTTMVHHPGRWRGFRTSLKRVPHDQTSIILLSNNDRNTRDISEQILNLIYAEDLQTLPDGKENNGHYYSGGSEE